MRLGPRVLCSLDPKWQAASKAFSILTESEDTVKVLTAAQVNDSCAGAISLRSSAPGLKYHVRVDVGPPRAPTESM